jgi:alpha-L-rhamnosidase
MRNLVEDIVEKHDSHLSTGIIGSNALVQVLPERGEASLMYKIATQTTFPSLGAQVMMGATTVCENYECGAWHSQNMKMFGSLDKFFYRNLAGIHLKSPGYRRVLIQPQPVGDLRHVSASQLTIRGLITVDWTREQESFDLRVSIPAGVDADIAVPSLGGFSGAAITEGAATVWKSGAYVPGTSGLTGAKADSDSVLFHAGSGSYHFIYK